MELCLTTGPNQLGNGLLFRLLLLRIFYFHGNIFSINWLMSKFFIDYRIMKLHAFLTCHLSKML